MKRKRDSSDENSELLANSSISKNNALRINLEQLKNLPDCRGIGKIVLQNLVLKLSILWKEQLKLNAIITRCFLDTKNGELDNLVINSCASNKEPRITHLDVAEIAADHDKQNEREKSNLRLQQVIKETEECICDIQDGILQSSRRHSVLLLAEQLLREKYEMENMIIHMQKTLANVSNILKKSAKLK